ncbi:MAG TPA: SET domain-containing protein-lysine N-methyltransferase [Azospirillaceae bacterium]|nr:SET domain-containing protein-lysine N-methyltransferase [Azospirillaceae bacterium]
MRGGSLLLPTVPLEVRDFPGKGRGLVAVDDIPAGTLISTAPVLLLDPGDRARASHTRVRDYYFWWEDAPADAQEGEGPGAEGAWSAAVALGPISVCNHARPANARFEIRRAERCIDLYAAIDIRAGSEITIDYDCEIWFPANAADDVGKASG